MTKITIKEGLRTIPPGIYVLRVMNIKLAEAKRGANAGNSFLTWEDEIVESPDHPEYVGEIFRHTSPVGCSPRSKYYKLFTSLGVQLADGQKELEFDTDDLLNREFVAQIKLGKVESGENAGSDKNEFENIWSIEEFTELSRKSSAFLSKLAPAPAPVRQPITQRVPQVNEATPPPRQNSPFSSAQSPNRSAVKSELDFPS